MSADKNEDQAAAPDVEGAEKIAPEKGHKRGRKKLALLAAVAVVLLGGAGFGAWEAHLLSFSGEDKAEAGRDDGGRGASRRVLLQVPPATANLDNGAGRTVYVKMTASVEVEGVQSLAALHGRLRVAFAPLDVTNLYITELLTQ